MKSFVATVILSLMLQQSDPEARVIEYLRTHTTPGRPVVVSDLLNNVFKKPEEQQALQRLFNTFFKIPLTAAQLYSKTNKTPTLKQLSDQFGFRVPGEMDVILKVMEADPRIPRFFERNKTTGEITKIDVAAIKADPRFAVAIERTIAGWEGRPEPPFSIKSFAGQPLTSTQFAGKPHLIYFWFTHCPPCTQTMPLLVKLYSKYSSQGFQIVAANADHVLDLPYDDGVRADYLKKAGATFTAGHVTPEMQQAYGGVGVFPTMFFVNRKGQIVKHLVSFHDEKTLDAAIQETLK
jgi:cytochrome c biogenesis protein CcmG, thiol:disulfide interchange protein DsbE